MTNIEGPTFKKWSKKSLELVYKDRFKKRLHSFDIRRYLKQISTDTFGYLW